VGKVFLLPAPKYDDGGQQRCRPPTKNVLNGIEVQPGAKILGVTLPIIYSPLTIPHLRIFAPFMRIFLGKTFKVLKTLKVSN